MFSSQGISEAAPDWWPAAEAQPTAPSSIQHSSRMWISKSLQPSWAGITNSSSSGSLLLALDKTSAAEGKTHSCEKSKFPHEEQVPSCAHVLQEQSHIPDCLLQSPVGTQRTTNSFSARGSFLSFVTQRDRIPAKYTVEDSPRDKKLLLFLNRLIPQDTISERHTACQLVGKRTKGGPSSSIRSPRKPTHTLWTSGWQSRNLHVLLSQQGRQESTVIYINRFLV